jgi:hypothetical protein
MPILTHLAAAGVSTGRLRLLSRGGHPLLALPENRQGARAALALYQPQRRGARWVASALGLAIPLGCQRLLPTASPAPDRSARAADGDDFPFALRKETLGILFGSPDHRISRAVLSYQGAQGWEVAKLAMGSEGRVMLEREAAALAAIPAHAARMAPFLGLHSWNEGTWLRSQRVAGRALAPGDSTPALEILRQWVHHDPPKPITDFEEWTAVKLALCDLPGGETALGRLHGFVLRPVIRHGDFARWNLLREAGGRISVMDWEWGAARGLPGIDLVHFFLQDARLVQRLTPADALRHTLAELARPECRALLDLYGWGPHAAECIIACLAYKQGSNHQDNHGILAESLRWPKHP